MLSPLDLDFGGDTAGRDNITDRSLEQFHDRYNDQTITKDDIWEYLYGVMHAPDWRERFQSELRYNLPRVPLAEDLEAFRSAGRSLIDLHLGYDTAAEHPVGCLLDGIVDNEGAADPKTDPEAYRIVGKMRWGRMNDNPRGHDRSVLEINTRCRLVGIPDEAHTYIVSGRSPLQWAIDTLRYRHDTDSGISNDPNKWHEWAEQPYNLIRHLRRLIHVAVCTTRIVTGLPPAL